MVFQRKSKTCGTRLHFTSCITISAESINHSASLPQWKRGLQIISGHLQSLLESWIVNSEGQPDLEGGKMDDPRQNEQIWAEQTAREILKRRDEDKLKKEHAVIEHQTKSQEIHALWSDVKECIKRKALLITKSIGEDDILVVDEKPDEIVIRISESTSRVIARRENFTIRCFLVNTTADYNLKIMNGEAVFCDRSGSPSSPDQIAQHLLSHLTSFLR